MEEVWKDIKGYEGLYQISNTGKVKSLKRIMKSRKCEEIIKKPSKLPKGYLKVSLCKEGKIKYYSIHRLVAEAFIPNPNNLPCVNHKDCNPQNNEVSNLEWISYKENNSYKNHNLKRSISSAIYYLKNDYPKEQEIISQLEKIKEKINCL